ncbi:DUF4259 domain-containing protein [Lentzea sp. NBRC 102530]|uniref:DUF4259 domain-containing protein n=1 Tax=Lentzea sp. NBRC 102530 TaxID=3032201 RepID=UPI0024A13113|nr:DUF4259 domain-containing protein [Lentzea sp. NBRC 102530]GLY48399.1 hypothetical protein Lesp01_20550 [Lentzea sp. NBRC 102530]
MITRMGTWDIGHFDNDAAADFSGALDDAPQNEREAIIRTALVTTIETEGFLDSYDACKVMASAALIAAQLPGGTPIVTSYAPDEPMPVFSPELRPLAVRALDRVLEKDSELAELWDETEYAEKWRQSVAELRAVLLT